MRPSLQRRNVPSRRLPTSVLKRTFLTPYHRPRVRGKLHTPRFGRSRNHPLQPPLMRIETPVNGMKHSLSRKPTHRRRRKTN